MKDFKETAAYQTLNDTLSQTASNVVRAPQSVDHLQHLLKGQSMVRQSAEVTQNVRKLAR